MKNGYIYILINPALHKDLLKIGKTTRLPEERAKEISSTGVPAEYRVAYDIETSDVDYAEYIVHHLLDEYRYTRKREFFKIPLKIAIKEVTNIIAKIESNPGNKEIFNDRLKSKRTQSESQKRDYQPKETSESKNITKGMDSIEGKKNTLEIAKKLNILFRQNNDPFNKGDINCSFQNQWKNIKGEKKQLCISVEILKTY